MRSASVDSALSLGNPLEVFDHIGHVSLCSTDAGRLKSFVEHSSSRAHERLTLEIFIVSRLLSHQQCSRGTPAFTKNGLGGIFEQRVTLTASGRFSERVDGDFGGKKLKRADCGNGSRRHEFNYGRALRHADNA